MATVTKPIALDESINTTEGTSRNIADVLAQELSNIATAISGGSDKVPKTDIATVEPTNVASRAYNIGELVYVNGNLYKVITAISGGATFTVGTNIQSANVSNRVKEVEDKVDAIDVSNSFSASNSAVHISATKRGNRVTLTASGYGSSFGNGTAIYINDGSLAPNTSSGTYLGGGSGVSISTQQYVYTIGQYTYNGTTHIIAVFHSQNIAVDAVQFSVTYETA